MTSGVWKQSAEDQRQDRGEAHPLAEPQGRLDAEPDVESSRNSSVTGRTPKKQRNTPAEEQAERERQELLT